MLLSSNIFCCQVDKYILLWIRLSLTYARFFAKKDHYHYTYCSLYIIAIPMPSRLVHYLVEIIDFITISVIFVSFCWAFLSYLFHHSWKAFGRPKHKETRGMNTIRLKLWQNLLFALELLICADIILSVQDPSIENLLQLWAIVIIRILIAYFLQREIHEIEEHKKGGKFSGKKIA